MPRLWIPEGCRDGGRSRWPRGTGRWNIGVPAGDWQRNSDLLGEERASLCLMLVDRNVERRDRYRVRNLPKAFGGMIRRESRRRGVADRLLAELRQFLVRLEREG